jgi:alpha-1,2-mannosyltransferase
LIGGKGDRVRRIAGLVALGLTVVTLLVLSRWFTGHFDLKIYWGATRSWLNGGDLYGFVQEGRDREYGFTYPPFAALAFVPLALLPWPVAVVALDAATIAATLAVLHWLLGDWRRADRALALTAGLLLCVALDPWRATYNYGQINVLLLALVAADLLILLPRGHRLAGVLIGVAAAVKLVPALFILYLLLTRRWRAAATAAGTAAGVTLLMVLFAPAASIGYWTDNLWQSNRIGDPAFVSNQSLNGLAHRVGLGAPLWLALAVVVLAFWAWTVRRVDDPLAGLALTGAVACLVSPITWVHHLVWLIPAVTLLARAGPRWARWAAVTAYALLCSRLVWLFNDSYAGWGHLGAEAYVLVTVFLLVAVGRRV